MIFQLELYLICLATIFCLLFIGQAVLKVFGIGYLKYSGFYSLFFYKILTGFIFATVLKSVVSTRGNTINIFFLLPLMFFIFERINNKKSIINREFKIEFGFNKNHCYLWIMFSLIFLLNSSYLYSLNGSFKIPSEDLFYYSKISNALGYYRNENLLFSANANIFSHHSGIALYHFFDLWFNTILTRLGVFSDYISLYFITIPLLAFVMYTGIVSLWEYFGRVTLLKLFFSMLLVFTAGLTYQFYDHFVYMQNTIPGFTNTMPFSFYGRKLVIVYVFALLIANLFLAGKRHIAIQCILLTTVVYSSGTFIGLSGAMIVLVVVSAIFGKKNTSLFYIEARSKLFILLFTTLIILFSYFNKQSDFYNKFSDKSLLDFQLTSAYLGSLRSAVAVVFYAMLFIGFCYFSYLLIFLINYKILKAKLEDLKQFIFIIALALLVGMFSLFIFYTQLDARQFLTNLFPFINVVCLLLIIIILENALATGKLSFKLISGLILFAFISYQNILFSYTSQSYRSFNSVYSAGFRNKTESLLKALDKNTLIGYYYSGAIKKYNSPLFSKWTFLDVGGFTNLVQVPNDANLVLLNLGLFKNNLVLKKIIEPTDNAFNFKLNFIKVAKLSVIVTDTIQSFIPNSIIEAIAYDSISHECVYVLKQ